MGHKYDPESLKTIMRLQGEQAAAGRLAYPPRVRYVTMTVRYPDCFWVSILRQQHQYERSLVDAEKRDNGWRVKTENVALLRLTLPAEWRNRGDLSMDIDGQNLKANIDPKVDFVQLEHRGEHWSPALNTTPSPNDLQPTQKVPGQTSPIDDAFTAPFLCVRGTGKPWNAGIQRHADLELERFAPSGTSGFEESCRSRTTRMLRRTTFARRT